jgi:hypothetical protein
MTLYGGCNCRSVRYRVNVPPHTDRPTAPYHRPDITPDERKNLPKMPCVLMDHCNDCRQATGSVFPMWVVTDVQTVEISVLDQKPASPVQDKNSRGQKSGDEDRKWQPLTSVIDKYEGNAASSPCPTTSFGHYSSSADRNRWFCKNCGTPLAYSVNYAAYPEPWKAVSAPRMFDIFLGTFDREHLEKDWMSPDHAIWCHFGIPWAAEIAKIGARRPVELEEAWEGGAKTEALPRHPLFMVDQDESADISGWLKILEQLK